MNNKNFASVAGTIFAIVAIMHALRLVYGWPIQIGDYVIPTWASVVGILVAGYLAVQGLRLKK